MRDPATVAFQIKYPWSSKPSGFYKKGYRASFITVWHNDPCTDGSDDSCRWTWPKLTKEEDNKAENLIDNEFDNLEHWFPDCDRDDSKSRIKQKFRIFKKLKRPWYEHPKWHFWHWSLQIHPWQKLKRFIFDRCGVCGRGFKWGYAPIGVYSKKVKNQWVSGHSILHHSCSPHYAMISKGYLYVEGIKDGPLDLSWYKHNENNSKLFYEFGFDRFEGVWPYFNSIGRRVLGDVGIMSSKTGNKTIICPSER